MPKSPLSKLLSSQFRQNFRLQLRRRLGFCGTSRPLFLQLPLPHTSFPLSEIHPNSPLSVPQHSSHAPESVRDWVLYTLAPWTSSDVCPLRAGISLKSIGFKLPSGEVARNLVPAYRLQAPFTYRPIAGLFIMCSGGPPLSPNNELEASSVMTAIPKGLSQPEIEVYRRLIHVSQEREAKGQRRRPVVVISDIGKDYDDLSALVVLKELHRLKLVKLVAVVANLMPAEKRARLARGALDSLGLRDVPVATGSRGSLNDHKELDYEFVGDFIAPTDVSHQNGQELLLDIYRTAKDKGTKLVLVCLSSLQDIQQFASTHGDLVAECTAEVHMQGGNDFIDDGNFKPVIQAANNVFNFEAAVAWHSFIQKNALSSHTYTKAAGLAAPLPSDLFDELQATGHPIGAYLPRVHIEQNLAFYEQACESDPKKRFAPFMDQNWFLANKTSWHQRSQAEGDMLPVGREVIPYLTKILLYDVLAALGAAGHDVPSALNIFETTDRVAESGKANIRGHHRIADPSTVDPERISVTVSALMKGSLLAVQQGILSNPS